MTTKTCIWIGFFIGSSLGEVLPTLWHGDPFGFAAILWSAVGGFIGIYAGYKIGTAYFG